MSVYQRNGVWHYDFWVNQRRHTSAKGFPEKADAREAEAHRRLLETRRDAGLEALDAKDTPSFTNWAGVTFKWQRDRKAVKRPAAVKNTLRMILAFWGAKPATDPVEGGAYHNLRLGDPIQRPELIEAFEAWMTARGLSGARKNHYRSACSMLYRVALLPANRRRSGVRENPFAGVLRDRVARRTTTLTIDDLQRWTATAPVPVAIAVTIAALAPALRFGNIVDLKRRDCSPGLEFLTVPGHKTDRETGLPLTVAISPPLAKLLAAIAAQWPRDPYVVPIEGARARPGRRVHAAEPKSARYWHLLRLVRLSITAAGLTYGRREPSGVTFHSLRHALATWLARWGLSVAERQRALGHATPAMAAWYTHLGGADTIGPMRLIGDRVTVADGVVARIEALPKRLPRRRGLVRRQNPSRRRQGAPEEAT